jgi:hypothetical protein
MAGWDGLPDSAPWAVDTTPLARSDHRMSDVRLRRHDFQILQDVRFQIRKNNGRIRSALIMCEINGAIYSESADRGPSFSPG